MNANRNNWSRRWPRINATMQFGSSAQIDELVVHVRARNASQIHVDLVPTVLLIFAKNFQAAAKSFTSTHIIYIYIYIWIPWGCTYIYLCVLCVYI